jgi:hypothetical protein
VFSVPFANLNHDQGDFVQVAFLDAQDAESDFDWPFDTMKHASSFLTNSFFCYSEGTL